MNAKLLAPFALLAAAAGCATYHARPLTGRAVDEAQARDAAERRASEAELRAQAVAQARASLEAELARLRALIGKP